MGDKGFFQALSCYFLFGRFINTQNTT